MTDINSVTIVGRLTRDAELKYTANGTAQSGFSIAVNRSVKKGEQWVEEVSFFNLDLWGKQAEGLSKYLTKGQQVAIIGELVQERWDKDGQTQSRIKIKPQNIQLLGGKKEGGASRSAEQPQKAGEFDPDHAFDDDIPF